MLSNKAVLHYRKYYTRKDRRTRDIGLLYKTYMHYGNSGRLKYYRKLANQRLRRYKGDVANHGWYKRKEEVMWLAF